MTFSGVSFPFTFTVVIWERSLCVLDSEVLILASSPQRFHFIVIIRVSVRITVDRISEVHFISDDAITSFSEKVIFFVKLSLVLSDGHIETLLLEVGLLLFTDGGLLQHLFGVSQTSLPGAFHRRFHRRRWRGELLHRRPSPGVIGDKGVWSSRWCSVR